VRKFFFTLFFFSATVFSVVTLSSVVSTEGIAVVFEGVDVVADLDEDRKVKISSLFGENVFCVSILS
jgi:hypothetical protein